MGVSTDGLLFLGVVMEEGWEAPWEQYEEDGWWEALKGNEPMPFELVNYCSGDCPMWAIAVPDTLRIANRGYPVAITVPSLTTDLKLGALEKFMNFLTEFEIKPEQGVGWYLASYWG